MAKHKAIAVPEGMRKWVPRVFAELGCPEYADDLFKAFAAGDLDAVVARVWGLGYMTGANLCAKYVRRYCAELGLPISASIEAGHVGFAYVEKVRLHLKGIVAMRAARQQADVPEAVKRAAVAEFARLRARYKAAGKSKPCGRAAREVCRKHLISPVTLYRARKSFVTL